MTIKKSTVSEVKMQQGRKLAFQLIVGGLVGGLASYFGLGLLGVKIWQATSWLSALLASSIC